MLGRTSLTPVAEARSLLLEQLQGTSPEVVTLPIEEGLDRILAEPIFSAENLPPHPRSVMDGFAVCAADTFGASESMPCYLQITGNVAMGEMPEGVVQRGCCYKIATGGFLPKGADAVIMHEHTVPVDETMIEIVKGGGPGTAIIGVGDDIREGEEALQPGHLLRPQDLGLLAALGITEIKVYRQVRVGIVSTGDEIVPHSEQPGPGKIRNINSIALAGLISRAGATPTDYGIVSDQREVFFPLLQKALKENDMVLFSGGSSVGVRDLGEQAVESLGPPGILVHGVKLKPGKPVLIGLSGTQPVFGLPGHPVSALVCFELFVAPAIRQLSGAATALRPVATVRARLARNLNSAAGRLDLVRVRLIKQENGYTAEPVMGKSGAISTLSRAHGYFLIDEESQGVNQDSLVEVYIYS